MADNTGASSRQPPGEDPVAVDDQLDGDQEMVDAGPSAGNEQPGSGMELVVADPAAGNEQPGSGMELVVVQSITRQRASLNTLPAEIQMMIIEELAPIWAYNYSNAVRSVFYLLRSQLGNRIFYNIMPAAMYMERDMFQLAVPQRSFPRPLLSTALVAANSPAEANLDHPVRPSVIDIGSWRVYGRSSIPRVWSLGGSYRPDINYRVEFVARLANRVRCMACFVTANHDPKIKFKDQWGVTWCTDCLLANTVDREDLISLVGIQFGVTPLLHNALRYTTTDKNVRYFIPRVNDWLRQLGLGSLELLEASITRAKHVAKLEILRIAEPTEAERRKLRRLIVAVAEAIWAGLPIGPVLERERRLQRTRRPAYLTYHDPDLYSWPRERWAAASQIGSFLFPQYRLSGDYDGAPYDDGTYPDDPTVPLIPIQSGKKACDIRNRKLVDVTHGLLDYLATVAVFRPTPEGTSVINWENAAKDYHRGRLLEELRSGWALRAHRASGYSRIGDLFSALTATLELAHPRSDVLYEVPPYPELEKFFRAGGRPAFEAAFTTYNAEKRRLDNAYAEFARIAAARCCMCPVGRHSHHPFGLDALLEHMTSHHPDVFYFSDGWTIVG